jgi:hypothetical protein
MYEVSDNGKIIGMTSSANGTAAAFAETPEEAVADKRFSRGEFNLAKGHHEITINVHKSPYGVGSGAVRVVKKLQALYGKDHDDDDDDEDDEDDKDWDHDDDKEWDHDDDEDDEDDKDWEHDDDKDDKHHKHGKKHGKKVVYVYHTIPCKCETTAVPLVDPEEKVPHVPKPPVVDINPGVEPIDPTTSFSRKESLMELIIDIFSDIHSHRRHIKNEHRSVLDNIISVATSGHDNIKTAIHSDIKDLLSDKMSKINAKLPALRMARA